MSVQPLQSNTPITVSGDMPSAALVQIIQQMARKMADLEARVRALEP